MKKFYLALAFAAAVFTNVSAQCTIDANATPEAGIYPSANNLPCIVTGVAYDQTLQVKAIKDTSATIIILGIAGTLDSIRVDTIDGLPFGINWERTPEILYGGENGCLRFYGTTTDVVQDYPLIWRGTAWLHFTAPIDTHFVYNGNLSRFQFGGYYLSVINPGDVCHPNTGISDLNKVLNSSLAVYPNPSNGSFELKLDAGQRINGEIAVVDITGRKVYAQPIDVAGYYNTNISLSDVPKGLYTVQVRTENGVASKNISIQ